MQGGAAITPASARFFAAPAPIVFHVSSIVVWSLLGAFQFSGGLRRRYPGWHRAAGRVLMPAGIITYPPVVHDGPILEAIRWVVSVAWLAFIVLGFVAIRDRDIARHRAWMIRSFAIGLGAGTQVLTHLPFFMFDSMHNELGLAWAMGSGWGINLLVAEWILRRPATVPPADESLDHRGQFDRSRGRAGGVSRGAVEPALKSRSGSRCGLLEFEPARATRGVR